MLKGRVSEFNENICCIQLTVDSIFIHSTGYTDIVELLKKYRPSKLGEFKKMLDFPAIFFNQFKSIPKYEN